MPALSRKASVAALALLFSAALTFSAAPAGAQDGGYATYQTRTMVREERSVAVQNDKPAGTCTVLPKQETRWDEIVTVTNWSNVTVSVWENADCTGREIRVAPGRQKNVVDKADWVVNPQGLSFDRY